MSLQRMCSVHLMPAEHIACITRERDKGATAAPLSIPAAPRGNRCCALRSPPAQLTDGRLDSTSRLVSPLAAIPGVQSLSSGLRFAGFSGDSTPAQRRFSLPGARVARVAAASHPGTFTCAEFSDKQEIRSERKHSQIRIFFLLFYTEYIYSSSRCCSSEPLSMARFTSAKAPMAER